MKITIEIDIKYGSEFQEQVFNSMIEHTMYAVEQSFNSRHKKNKMVHDITYYEKPVRTS